MIQLVLVMTVALYATPKQAPEHHVMRLWEEGFTQLDACERRALSLMVYAKNKLFMHGIVDVDHHCVATETVRS